MEAVIIELVKKTGGGVSFVELSKIEGFSGEYWFGEADNNIFYWFSCSEAGTDAINNLRKKGIIALVSTSATVYHADGLIPTFPIVNKAKKYKHPRWQPAAINKGSRFHDF